MLVLSGHLLDKQVLSLRTNTPVAIVTNAIIDPNNLKIEGFYCRDNRKNILILLTQDIRETVEQGYIVNDHEVLTKEEDLVRLKPVIDIAFNPMGMNVVTESGSKVGKVSDYAAEIESMYILKIYVTQSLIKNFSGGNLIVDRNQIIEITPKKIVVDDLLLEGGVKAEATIPAA